jgi:2-dehydro-3-deoxyphosphogluconate aldolase/(4S)-4-hydroxy-2-oxoglutarate aldolase
MQALLWQLTASRLLPVLVVQHADTAAHLGAALYAGGLPIAEVTFRTDAALESISTLARRGDLTVGAGTVTDPAQVDAAVDAGATFVVSPGFSLAVVTRCRDRGVPAMPGVATPTDVMAAVAAGFEVLKLFPASVLGGPAGVAALAAAFPAVRFVPTGGIGATTAAAYLDLPSVLAVGGSWMAPAPLIAAGDQIALEAAVRAAVAGISAATQRSST